MNEEELIRMRLTELDVYRNALRMAVNLLHPEQAAAMAAGLSAMKGALEKIEWQTEPPHGEPQARRHEIHEAAMLRTIEEIRALCQSAAAAGTRPGPA